MRKNIVWLDYARVLGISLVIFGHALQRFPAFEESSWLMWLWDYIYLFHMPLFFIISGFLFRVAPITMENIRSGGTKIVKTLIIPYFLGFASSLIVSYYTLRWFKKAVSDGKLIYFSIYCLILGILVITLL